MVIRVRDFWSWRVRGSGVGTVVELADQFHGPVEGMEASVAMVTDMHHAAAEGAIAIEDVELPGGEIRSLGQVKAMVLPSERRREQRDKPSLSLCLKSRGF